MITEKRFPSGAVDKDVARLEHRHCVRGRDDRRTALHAMRFARIDQVAEGALDGVERGEPFGPSAQKDHEIRRMDCRNAIP